MPLYNPTSGSSSSVDPSSLAPTFVTLTDGATITLTCDANKTVQNNSVTLGGNRALVFSGLASGMTGVLVVKQDAVGGRTLSLPVGSRVQNSGNGTVTLTATANAVDVLSWTYDGTNTIWTVGNQFN